MCYADAIGFAADGCAAALSPDLRARFRPHGLLTCEAFLLVANGFRLIGAVERQHYTLSRTTSQFATIRDDPP